MEQKNKRSKLVGHQMSASTFFQSFFGAFFLLFSAYALFESESSKSQGKIYEEAKPIKIAEDENIVHVHGKISASPIESQFVKPGNYISIKHQTEIYTWADNVIDHGSTSRGNYRPRVVRCDLGWQSEMIRPEKTEKCKDKTLYEPTIKNEMIHPKDAKIEADGKSYFFEAHNLNYSSNIQSKTLAPEDTILNGFFADDRYLYINPSCANKGIEGCERITISVIPIPKVDTLLIGKFKENKIIAMNEETSNEEEESFNENHRDKIYIDTDTFEDTIRKFNKENIDRKKEFRYTGFFGIFIGFFLCRKFFIYYLTAKFGSIPYYEDANLITRFFIWLLVPVAMIGFIIFISYIPIPVLLLFGGVGYFIYVKYNKKSL